MKFYVYALMASAFALTPAFAEGDHTKHQSESAVQATEASAQSGPSAIQEVNKSEDTPTLANSGQFEPAKSDKKGNKGDKKKKRYADDSSSSQAPQAQ